MLPKLFTAQFPSFVQRALEIIPDTKAVTIHCPRIDRAILLVNFPDGDSLMHWFVDACPALYRLRLATKVILLSVLIIDKNINEGARHEHMQH